MEISKIIKKLDLDIVAGYDNESMDNKVQGVYICDLLSLVMAKSRTNDIWITIQTHVNIIAVASLMDLSGIIVAEDMEIDEETINKANDVRIPVLKSKLSAYELATRLNELGV